MTLELAGLEDYEGLGDTSFTEPLIWTPGALQAFAKQCHTEMQDFQNDMSSAVSKGKVPQNELLAWRTLRDSWGKWYGATSWSTWMWGATASVIESYMNQLKVFQDKFKKWTGTQPSGAGVLVIKSPLAGLSSPLIWLGVGAAGVVVLMLYLRLTGGGGGTTKIELEQSGGGSSGRGAGWANQLRTHASNLASRIRGG